MLLNMLSEPKITNILFYNMTLPEVSASGMFFAAYRVNDSRKGGERKETKSPRPLSERAITEY